MDGISIAKETKAMAKFIKTLESFFPDQSVKQICNDLKVPQVIVIGAESSGKSSLLEQLTKCAIFPRHTGVCTKMPLRVILTPEKQDSKFRIQYDEIDQRFDCPNDALHYLESMMTQVTDISQTEVHITIFNPDLPVFEFVDLPGIRAYGGESVTTQQLAESYINDPHSLVLCVVPASTPRLTGYLPLAMLKKNKKEHQTIIALTMVDRIDPDNMVELVVDRLVGTSDEDLTSRCVALFNRSDKDVTTLAEHDQKQKEWFDENLFQGMPSDYEYAEQLVCNIGIDRLMINLDDLYNTYIESNWIPNTLEKLDTELSELSSEIKNLGTRPDLIPVEELKDIYENIIDEQIKCQLLYDCDLKIIDYTCEKNEVYQSIISKIDQLDIDDNSSQFESRFEELNQKIWKLLQDSCCDFISRELDTMMPVIKFNYYSDLGPINGTLVSNLINESIETAVRELEPIDSLQEFINIQECSNFSTDRKNLVNKYNNTYLTRYKIKCIEHDIQEKQSVVILESDSEVDILLKSDLRVCSFTFNVIEQAFNKLDISITGNKKKIRVSKDDYKKLGKTICVDGHLFQISKIEHILIEEEYETRCETVLGL
jgi:GTP-binding protein EngB required for normal cell division